MIYKNQPFLFLNNDNKECLFYCEAEKTITLHFGNDYEITPWKVALIVDGVKTDIQLPRLLSEFGDIVIECNPHIIVENESPVFYYVAGFLLNEGSPIIYYLCSLETDWEFKEFKNLKIIKNTFSGTIINNEIISTNHFGRLNVRDIIYDSFGDIEHIYRIIPIYQNKNYFLITASINKEDVSIVVKSDLSLYCVLKNKENKNVYKSTILNNKIIYTVKNVNSSLVEDRSLVEEEFANDFELNLIPTNIKKNNPPLPVVKDLKHFAKGAVKAVKAMTLPETEESKARLAVCMGCDKWTGTSCKVCGCFVKLKVKIPQEKCPEGKW
tara:strand:- start:129 stop:1103 length:975 start_codon:yes stop_codon:yes gene_type:complete